MAAVGFACAYALSISWPAFEVMIFPGAALLIALALDWGGPSRISSLVRGIAVTLLLVLVASATARKHATPYYWGRWTEPPLESSMVEPKAPELRGFVLSPWTASFFDGISEDVRANSKPEDRILVYPNMPMLYALSERFPATFATMHWVDVCPDFVADADAQQLLRSPPAVIVLHPDLPEEIATEEMLFRDGRQSGVRNVLIALESLSPRYQVMRGNLLPRPVGAVQETERFVHYQDIGQTDKFLNNVAPGDVQVADASRSPMERERLKRTTLKAWTQAWIIQAEQVARSVVPSSRTS
jgi:hypothetical protein